MTGLEDDDISEIELEKSEYANKRNELMQNSQVPSLSDATRVLGKPLANLVFNQCQSALRVNFGLESPLQGPKGDMWVAPSDLLIGKVALTPPLTRKHIQALTHEGIMAIGHGIEQKFINEMEDEKAIALAHQRRILLESFDDIVRAEVKDAEQREKAAARREIERLTQDFENTLVLSLNNLEDNLRHEYQTLIQTQEEEEAQRWMKRMEEEVQKTVEEMTAQYLEKMAIQEEVLSKYFKHELSKAEIHRQYDLGKQDAKFRYRLRQLKHNLECKNLANMMYIICMERRKCYEEKLRIEKYYVAEISKLKGTIESKKSVIKKLNKEMVVKKQEASLRETCILEIIKQFQKFINFALRAAPTQAEFLLSVEKMMVFELVDAMLKSKLCTTQPPCYTLQPWMTPERYLSEADIPGLSIEDFHDCLNELPSPRKPNEGEDSLPSFTYKDRLYVREDFRDIILNGIELKPSDELWSKDVEILMSELRQVVKPSESQRLTGKGSKDSGSSRRSSILRRSHFDSRANVMIEDKQSMAETQPTGPDAEDPAFVAKTIPCQKASLTFKKPVTNKIDFQKIGSVEREPYLLSTRSSLELILEKGSVRQFTKDHEEESERIRIDKDITRHSPPFTSITSQTNNSLVYKNKGRVAQKIFQTYFSEKFSRDDTGVQDEVKGAYSMSSKNLQR
ncbi:unnamed protein product [Acanthoscelides obtectus]|uniref:Uncharacterized protein n=1 Tax=Acanthoscelides obtectus TaxID=200917 RepID=A0A9P0K710_ACAOB|nr:unnamed protein product [Acanthoscelides obtectus]CAK1646714.1 hypothetical protein AOBTE_LOCUS14833 [Acanthoscelides obtectus]